MNAAKHIAVIGAGPAGLMAAETLASAGMQVTVYDRMPTVGRKLLMAGRGGLNLTHSEPLHDFIQRYGSAATWLSPYIEAFPPQALRSWCEQLGEETFVGSSGRVFPRSMKAAPLLRAWLRRLNSQGVKFAMRHEWQGWDGEVLRFLDANGNAVRVTPDATLIALGGASWPRLGSNGKWVDIFSAHHISLSPLKPANCGFIAGWSEYFSERFAGSPLKPLSISIGNHTRQGEALITVRGIEGGVVYALSSHVREIIEKSGSALIHLDLRPDMTVASLTKKLEAPRANRSLSTHLRKAGFSPLAVALLREVTPALTLNELSASAMAVYLKSLPLTLRGTAGMERAISSAGGIAEGAFTDELMLRELPGNFVAGEMLDWEAPTGGYLLQACFSTAVAAARGIIRYVK